MKNNQLLFNIQNTKTKTAFKYFADYVRNEWVLRYNRGWSTYWIWYNYIPYWAVKNWWNYFTNCSGIRNNCKFFQLMLA